MGKILLVIGLVWLVVFLLRRQLNGRHNAPRTLREVQTVRCAHCGIHVPEPEAIRSRGHDYCTMEHRHLGPRGG